MINKQFNRRGTPSYDFENIEITLPPPVDGEDQSLYNRIYSGTERVFSVPENTENDSRILKQYLQDLIGKSICIALWSCQGRRIEKCGILNEVGGDYIVLKDRRSNRLLITRTNEIKYISVFCV